MRKKDNITLSLDKELIKELRELWRKSAKRDLEKNKKPRSFSEVVEYILKKGLEYIEYGT
jgi:uncharacterized protein YgfB (UPF0149 family)